MGTNMVTANAIAYDLPKCNAQIAENSAEWYGPNRAKVCIRTLRLILVLETRARNSHIPNHVYNQ